MHQLAIKVNNLNKIYRLYDKPIDRLKESLNPFNKKYHNDFYALKNINFEIRLGETIGIIGRNGSGKSTLLKIITGITAPTSGNIFLNGKVSALLELGAGFNSESTGIENIFFSGTIMGFTKQQMKNKLEEIISFADIGDYINQPVKTYSNGMYVRLAFAVAINIDPDILVIDEALSVGDLAFQIKCMQKIKNFIHSGKTLLFVSHDPGAVKNLCDNVYLLDKGQIIDYGNPDKVFDYYNTLISLKEEDEVKSLNNKETFRKRTGNIKIEIIEIQMLNENNIITDTFVSGEAVTIKMKTFCNEDVKNPTFGILIRDRLGNDIFGINNALMKKNTCGFIKGNYYEIKYNFPLNIGVNIYQLTVAAHIDETHINECFDWINNVVAFKVIPSPQYKFVGCCRIHSDFSCIKI